MTSRYSADDSLPNMLRGPASGAVQAAPADTPQFVLLNDQPVEEPGADLLGTAEVASDLATLVVSSRSSSPLVVAVDAGWGMGKSTLLRLVESRLGARPEITIVRFNAWTASGHDALEGLIKSVLMALRHEAGTAPSDPWWFEGRPFDSAVQQQA